MRSFPRFTASAQFAAHDAARLRTALDRLPRAGEELILALDLDGTTIRHDTSLSDRVAEAITAHAEAGSHIILATGRGIAATMIVAEQLGMGEGLCVCSNGAITLSYRDYDPAHISLERVHTFDPSRQIDRISRRLPQAVLAVEPAEGPRRVSAHFPHGELIGDTVVVPHEELGGSDATRLTVRVPDMSPTELTEEIEALGLDGVEYAVGWTAWLDISPAGVSKASAMAEVAGGFGLGAQNCLAVGDGANDVEMLSWAGAGIAMGDASDKVKAAADAATASVNDDGLALALEYLL
ncbi:MAG: HAD family hydrolase [Flaviflexus sp.]|nr:HAD family hydrolase [Flaviflexus sp.]